MRQRLAPLVVAAVCIGALAGCGTGLRPQTYKSQQRSFEGLSVQSIDIRNLGVDAPISGGTYPAGDSVLVTGSLVNTDGPADALVGASSPDATSAELLLNGSPTTSVPVPANGTAEGTWTVLLRGLKKPLGVGEYTHITLSFEKAGRSQELLVPVRYADNSLDTRQPEQNPYGE